MKQELKRCPFCGGKPEVGGNDGFFDQKEGISFDAEWWVICPDCGCDNGYFGEKESAIEDWNTRPREAELEKENAELKEGIIGWLEPFKEEVKFRPNTQTVELCYESMIELEKILTGDKE